MTDFSHFTFGFRTPFSHLGGTIWTGLDPFRRVFFYPVLDRKGDGKDQAMRCDDDWRDASSRCATTCFVGLGTYWAGLR